ncbi:ABC transporter ATP-binding protein [Thauera propionica]|jgi:putative ABC transport system ATP-binding protein|uniref:ABC transporter ATP-binding protein n=1 Tax=Thauera propionica TaxID=2019431 RepID=UPI0023F14440|nr:ABC transporter ATP-binding protein [Thauera propionica]MDD3676838.1 ABC transporter ATP-binding protein [Thauera propionica]
MAYLSLHNVSKHYSAADGVVRVLEEISLDIQGGEFVAIRGPSGCGKSTLLNILGCLDTWSRGQYLLDGIDIGRADDDQRAAIRLGRIGFVFQSFNLIPRLSVLRNVELPLVYGGITASARRRRATELLERLGLGDKLHATPAQLSGGQQQRVAIARALINEPSLLLLDEPTGNLDSQAGRIVMDIFGRLHAQGRTIVVVTHDAGVAARSQRVLSMRDGVLDGV